MLETLYGILGNSIYGVQAIAALWGAYCVVVVWRRLAQTRFRSEAAQDEFLHALDERLRRGDVQAALDLCGQDLRALPQLAGLAIHNRQLGYDKVRQLVVNRFQQDVLADMEHRLSWVQTVIRIAPMLGLHGTVLGMMAAFGKLGSGQKVDPSTSLASDISFALITTVVGLTIAIPLMVCTASINVRLRKLEDLMSGGLTHFFDMARAVLGGRQES